MNFFLFLRSLCLSVALSSSSLRHTNDVEVSFLPVLSDSNTHNTADVVVSFLHPLGNLTKAKEIDNIAPEEMIITGHKLVKTVHGNSPRGMSKDNYLPEGTFTTNGELVKIEHVDSSKEILQTLSLKSEKNDNDRLGEMIIHDELIEIEHTSLPVEILVNDSDKMGKTLEIEKEVLEEPVTNSYLFDYYSVEGGIVEVIVGEEWSSEEWPGEEWPEEDWSEEDSYNIDAYDTSTAYSDPPEGYSYDTSGGYTYYTYDRE